MSIKSSFILKQALCFLLDFHKCLIKLQWPYAIIMFLHKFFSSSGSCAMAANAPITMKETLTVSFSVSHSYPFLNFPFPFQKSKLFPFSENGVVFFQIPIPYTALSPFHYSDPIVKFPHFFCVSIFFMWDSAFFCSWEALESTSNSLHLLMWQWNRISTFVSGKLDLRTVLSSLTWACQCSLWDGP